MNEKPLPDIIDYNLDILFIGFNPGIMTAQLKHHYAYPGNRFWRFLYESGITPYKFTPLEDSKLLELGYGSTNIVDRATKGVSDLKRAEIEKGRTELKDFLEKYRPKIACYVGYSVYEAFSGRKLVSPGLQNDSIIPGIIDYVCSSTSGLNSIPIQKQIDLFVDLKKLSDSLRQ